MASGVMIGGGGRNINSNNSINNNNDGARVSAGSIVGGVKVYTRKAFRNSRNNINKTAAAVSTSSVPDTTTTTSTFALEVDNSCKKDNVREEEKKDNDKEEEKKDNDKEEEEEKNKVNDTAEEEKNKENEKAENEKNKEHDKAEEEKNKDYDNNKEEENNEKDDGDKADNEKKGDGKEVDSKKKGDGKEVDSKKKGDGKEVDSKKKDDDKELDNEKKDDHAMEVDNNENDDTANTTITTVETAATVTDNNVEKQGEENEKGTDERNSIEVPVLQAPALEGANLAQEEPSVLRVEVISDDSSSLNRDEVAEEEVTPSCRQGNAGNNGLVKKMVEDKLKINLKSKSKQEMVEIRKKLESELDTVRSLVKRIEAKEAQIGVGVTLGGGLINSRVPMNDVVYNGLKRVNSSVSSMGVPRTVTTPLSTFTPRQSRPLNQLSLSLIENSHGTVEHVEKEKRTPKANQFYRNSEFLLAKDKFPPAESNKKSKVNGKKHGGGDTGFGFRTGSKVFKNCSALLEKLMRHKHGWVFNHPVDVKGLGLHDYHTIITHPMDLGTIKSRLHKNWYKSPEEFAEDVRLTFHNAMTYNPKGQDAHVMAEILLNIFEERWAVIKSNYDREMMFLVSYDLGMHTPTPRKAPPLPPPPLDMRRILERTDSIPYTPVDPRSKPISTTPSARTPAPKKPKAKDLNKRDMTYEEKQKLSTNLQSLPLEKLETIIAIIKKRNTMLNQQGDEIEVDIDSVDAETLWELDRFVTNYKKSLSKNKRKAELAIQARAEAAQNVQQNPPAVTVEPQQETRTDERNVSTSSPVRVENHEDNGARSSSSSSSSSDSGSSSDSDSDSSSTSESDAGE